MGLEFKWIEQAQYRTQVSSKPIPSKWFHMCSHTISYQCSAKSKERLSHQPTLWAPGTFALSIRTAVFFYLDGYPSVRPPTWSNSLLLEMLTNPLRIYDWCSVSATSSHPFRALLKKRAFKGVPGKHSICISHHTIHKSGLHQQFRLFWWDSLLSSKTESNWMKKLDSKFQPETWKHLLKRNFLDSDNVVFTKQNTILRIALLLQKLSYTETYLSHLGRHDKC